MIRKEFRQIQRDILSLLALLVIPTFLVFLIGYAVNFDVKHISLAVYDQDNSQLSRNLIRQFSNTEYFDLNYNVSNYSEIERLMGKGKALVAIVIPPEFSKKFFSNDIVKMQVFIDGSNANVATIALGYISRIIQQHSSKLAIQVFEQLGGKFLLPIDFRPTIWYNPELATTKFLIPGIIGFILMIIGVVSTSLSVVREKERGTMEQLMISNLTTVEIILGKTVPYLVIGSVSSILVVAVGFTAFNVEIQGNILWLALGILLFLLCALGQGLIISTVAESQQVAFMISVFSSLLPTFLLSGFVFPIRSMPLVLQAISYIVPAKYFLIITRSVVLKGVGIEVFWEQFVVLLLFASIMIGLSSYRLLKKDQ